MSAVLDILPVVNLWDGCYTDGWTGEIVPEAFAHPAKYSRALIRRIYQHAFAEGWLVPGDTVVDPFGGVALGALDAMWNGLTWVGCELEPRFVGLAEQNIALWQRKYGSKFGFGEARILQGDSRKLSEVIASADLVCSSPPFHQSGVIDHSGQTNALIGKFKGGGDKFLSNYSYGQSPGQLGAMKEGDFDCVVSSPPFATGDSAGPESLGRRTDPASQRMNSIQGWGKGGQVSEGSLGSMPEGKFSAVVSSPPYAAIAAGAGGLNTKPGKDGQQSGRSPDSVSQSTDQHYGESAGQLSAMAEGKFDAVVSIDYNSRLHYDGEHDNRGNAQTLSFRAFPESGGETRGGQLDDGATQISICGNQNAPVVGGAQAGVRNRKTHWAGSKRPGSLGVEGREGYEGLSQEDQENAVRTVSGNDESLRPSQGFRPLQQRTRQPAGALCELSSESTQNRVSQDRAQEQRQGGLDSETFWEASRTIIQQCHRILRPGGHAIFVCKDFVRRGKRVPFSDQWQALCEAQGFRLVCRHRAMLVAHHGEQGDMLGEAKQLTTERKSFFRRLAEKKGSPAIDWEDVICMERV